MTTMLEKAAEAAREVIAMASLSPEWSVDDREVAQNAVRAALLAIREPDPALFANPDAYFVGFAQIGEEPEENVYLEPDEAAAAFKSVIDAILNETPET